MTDSGFRPNTKLQIVDGKKVNQGAWTAGDVAAVQIQPVVVSEATAFQTPSMQFVRQSFWPRTSLETFEGKLLTSITTRTSAQLLDLVLESAFSNPGKLD